ncbi:hypothetical protein HYC85_024868 [Camellia sinensis]|uniref:RNA helicase n=1 Tax=Camellia sinensis TaxID=4442 RepID=A0A7J7G9B4_CAMSI|nr:hypothetical protein HYC85_024868 [Camellia sinensis]
MAEDPDSRGRRSNTIRSRSNKVNNREWDLGRERDRERERDSSERDYKLRETDRDRERESKGFEVLTMASSPTSSSYSTYSSPFSSSPKFSDLPIMGLRHKIVEKIQENRATLIVGETGCGKSSQVPQFLLEENMKPILCTQPRRFAVVAVARMVAKALYFYWAVAHPIWEYPFQTIGEDTRWRCHNVVEDTVWGCHSVVEDTVWWCHNGVEDTGWRCQTDVEDSLWGHVGPL